MSRKFRNIGGFADGTDYVEVIDENMSYVVSLNGEKKTTNHYNLSLCLEFVKNGDWEEITDLEDKRRIAIKKLQEAEKACYEYFTDCDDQPDKDKIGWIYTKIGLYLGDNI